MKHNLLVLLLAVGLLAGCAKRYRVVFPLEYEQRHENGQTFATIPQGKTFADAIKTMDCGGQYVCEMRDLGRLVYIKQHTAQVLLQQGSNAGDLPKLVDCGEKFLCLVDPVAKTLTIIKQK